MSDATTSWERDKHAILGGKVHLYRRGDSDKWHCSAFLKGKNRRKSTKEDSLPLARQIAEDWYLELRGKARAGALPEQIEPEAPRRTRSSPKKSGAVPLGLKRRMTFNEAADQFSAPIPLAYVERMRYIMGHDEAHHHRAVLRQVF